MSELIDRSVLKARMYSAAFESDTDMQRWDSGCWIRYKLFENTVDNMPTVPYTPRWRRVEEEGLPPNAKHPGAFCKKYQVMTKWGVTEGWFNPDVGEDGLWDILVWFFMGHYDDVNDIDFERGDKPKLMWVTKGYVSAWREMPEPPKEEEHGN